MRRLKLTACLVIVISVAACAGQSSQETVDKNLAVRDFIELRELESLAKIRTAHSDGWDLITSTYLIYKTRRAEYLFEFARPCRDLYNNTRIIADERAERNVIRARFETLRGCRIAAIYALKPEEVAELQRIGEPPGSRN